MQRVDHHGRTTAYRTRGRGEPSLLFVHGSGGTHAVWTPQLSRLADDYAVTAVDLSGHGESDDVATEAGRETLDAYATDVLAVADAVDASLLVGNSLGGAVVLTALLDHGASPAGVVLAGSGAKLAVADPLRGWLDDDWPRVIEFLHGQDRFFHDPDDRYVAASRDAMQTVGRAVTRRDFRSCHTFDVRTRLDAIECPLLALTGEHDTLTPPAYHEYLADAVDDGSWQVVPDAAHLSMLEAPDAFNDALTRWLDGL